MSTLSSMMLGVADLPIEALKSLHIHPDAVKAKARKLRAYGGNADTATPSGQSSAVQSALAAPPSSPDNASQPSLVTSSSETSILTPSTSVSSIKRKPIPSGSILISPDAPGPASRPLSDGTSIVQSPISTVEDPAFLAAPASQTRTGPSAMAEALRNLPESSRPRSRSHGSPRAQSPARSSSPSADSGRKRACDPPNPLDAAMGTGKGLSRIIGVGLRSPMDFSLALAKGFHNVPKLYGEEVRSVDRVTGFKSGITTASKELGYGLFEGITGLVTKPYEGARKEGATGFVKGFGKGIAGAYLKPAAGAFGIPAYAMKGIYQEVVKRFYESTEDYIITARTAQGFEEWSGTTREFRIGVVHSYLLLLKETKKKRGIPGEESLDAVLGGGVEAVEKFIERRMEVRRRNLKKLAGLTRLKGKGRIKDCVPGELHGTLMPDIERADTVSSDARSAQRHGPISAAELHRMAIHEMPANPIPEMPANPIHEMPTNEEPALPSKENSSTVSYHHYSDNEDELCEDPTGLYEAETTNALEHEPELEEAIRQSIAHSPRGDEEEDRLIDQAIRASIAELQRTTSIDIEEEEAEDEELQKVLAESARLHQEAMQGGEQEDGNVGASRNGDGVGAHEDEEEQFRRAMEESLKMDEQRERERREEEIVTEYVKKASLAEEEFRRRIRAP